MSEKLFFFSTFLCESINICFAFLIGFSRQIFLEELPETVEKFGSRVFFGIRCPSYWKKNCLLLILIGQKMQHLLKIFLEYFNRLKRLQVLHCENLPMFEFSYDLDLQLKN